MRFLLQHHPSRVESLRRLLDSLPFPATVVVDPHPDGRPSAWRTYRACLQLIGDEPAVIIQDDAVCQPGFVTAAVAAHEQEPEALISFFSGAQPRADRMPMLRCHDAHQPFYEVGRGRFIHTVALLWPPGLPARFLEWADTVRKVRGDYLADDPLVGEWAGRQRIRSLQTVPSLVEHPDDQVSLCKRRANGRTALLLADDCEEWVRTTLRSADTVATVAAAR